LVIMCNPFARVFSVKKFIVFRLLQVLYGTLKPIDSQNRGRYDE
jgi:hypothetical protein